MKIKWKGSIINSVRESNQSLDLPLCIPWPFDTDLCRGYRDLVIASTFRAFFPRPLVRYFLRLFFYGWREGRVEGYRQFIPLT